MNSLSKTKFVLYLAAIFLAGGVTGATVAVKATRQISEAPPSGHFDARYLKQRFQSKLSLTPEQAKTIEPILDKMSDELKSVRADTTKRIGAIVKNSYEQIGKQLTPEQRLKLDAMKKERSENNHRRFKPSPESPRP